jgi:hypothetical protein
MLLFSHVDKEKYTIPMFKVALVCHVVLKQKRAKEKYFVMH